MLRLLFLIFYTTVLVYVSTLPSSSDDCLVAYQKGLAYVTSINDPSALSEVCSTWLKLQRCLQRVMDLFAPGIMRGLKGLQDLCLDRQEFLDGAACLKAVASSCAAESKKVRSFCSTTRRPLLDIFQNIALINPVTNDASLCRSAKLEATCFIHQIKDHCSNSTVKPTILQIYKDMIRNVRDATFQLYDPEFAEECKSFTDIAVDE